MSIQAVVSLLPWFLVGPAGSTPNVDVEGLNDGFGVNAGNFNMTVSYSFSGAFQGEEEQ